VQFIERLRGKPLRIISALALLAIGGAAGSAATHTLWPARVMAPGPAVAISSLAALTQPLIGERVVTVRGTVAEVYGSSFVLADNSGRILVRTSASATPLVAANQTVSVQGRFADGTIRAAFLVGADGSVTALHGGHHRGHGDHGGSQRFGR
jgi:uncharacterized protein YdeI (BOF family)